MKYANIIVFSLSILLNPCHLIAQSKAKDTLSTSDEIEYNADSTEIYFMFLLKIDSIGPPIEFSRYVSSFFCCEGCPVSIDSLHETREISNYLPLNWHKVRILTDTNFMAFNNDYGNRFYYIGAFRNGRRIDTFQLTPLNENKHGLVEVFDSLGLRHGYYTAYDTLGKRIHRGYFEHGTGYDKEFWYDTRGIRQKGRYVKGYKTGVWYYYDRHSKLRRKEYYEMGKLMKAVEVQKR